MSELRYLADDAKIGIVNRGEPALRFIRAVKEYNALRGTRLSTVAIYIDAEENAPFVKLADEAIAFTAVAGYPGTARSPYLDHDVILQALRQTGCTAVWPGWGFVSEDAEFVKRLEEAEIVFLGPSSAAMGALGDKIQAKELAERADVPVLPWSRGHVRSLEEAREVSERLGYPVILKAANAGGGRGIRFVHTEDQLEGQFKSARDETIRITGGDALFIELLVRRGRHLEVQCLADRHGNVNTFGVRDCSVQRRNQKIIEETPPPGFSNEKIAEIEAAAARLISEAGYASAGTVEYLYDLERDQFFFMEVNTRLQVEHPISEQLYGVDLVKGQIDVARGETVSFPERYPEGAVIEVRLNAEDPDRDFSPSPGDVEFLKFPAGPGIRIDSGIEAGSSIPPDFDSMVAKIIVTGTSRPDAIARLRRALTELRIRIKNGTTNKAFLLELLAQEAVQQGGVDTGFVERYLQERMKPADDRTIRAALLAGAIELSLQEHRQDFLNFRQEISKSGRPRNLPSSGGQKVTLACLGNSYDITVRAVGHDTYHLYTEGGRVPCIYRIREEERVLILDDARHSVLMVPRGDILQAEVDGIPVPLASESGGFVRSPSPAIVLSVNVEEGQQVEKGELLLVLEAMKMEMVVEAPADGSIKELLVGPGAQVAAGQALLQQELGDGEEEAEAASSPPVELAAAGGAAGSASAGVAGPSAPAAGAAGTDAAAQPADAGATVSAGAAGTAGTGSASAAGAAGTAASGAGWADPVEQAWRLTEREMLSLFYGYDAGGDAAQALVALIEMADEYAPYRQRLAELILQTLEAHVAVERLFTQGEVESSAYTRPMSYQELLSHYFRRDTDREKGLPETFLNHLNRALSYYPQAGGSADEDWQSYALFHLFRSHGRAKEKHEIVRRALFALERLELSQEQLDRLTEIIDELVQISTGTASAVTDAALYIRHQMIEQTRLRELKERQVRAVEELLAAVVDEGSSGTRAESQQSLRSDIINAGPSINRELLRRSVKGTEAARRTATELAGLRLSRDRSVHSVAVDVSEDLSVCAITAETDGRTVHTLFVVAAESDYDSITSLPELAGRVGLSLDGAEGDSNGDGGALGATGADSAAAADAAGDSAAGVEVCILARTDRETVQPEEVEPPARLPAPEGVAFMACGLYPARGVPGYRSFAPAEPGGGTGGAEGEGESTGTGTRAGTGGSWREIELRHGFGPLTFRELRVYRLANFDLKRLYYSENVTLLEAKAKENPKDVRLFALCAVSEHEPELGEENDIERMVMLEAVYTEAMQALRVAQSQYRYRLQWNRVIIHNRTLLSLRLMQLKDYGLKLLTRAKDLGIERVVVYSRRKRWREDVVREIELDYFNVSENQFTLRSREPSDELLQPLDAYGARVVRARQRSMIYPYEFIKIITYAGFPLQSGFPRGEFEEHDIEIGQDGRQQVVSVADREPGQNSSNIVFGIITNHDRSFPVPLRRVIVLSDPTTDIGSLAEGECRRVIAALDLADREGIPVEWIPISSGARITMETGTENLDWTAAVIRRIVQFTQNGGEINVIVSGVNVGAQSYWNAEATMLMHTRGLLIMTSDAAMLLTGKKALEFSGSVSAESNVDIGGVEKVMGPNGESQVRVPDLASAYEVLFRHYRFTYVEAGTSFPPKVESEDDPNRDITNHPYEDRLEQGFSTIGDIFSQEKNPERKKQFDMRQVMGALIDTDAGYLERWRAMQDADTAIVWETRMGGNAVGMIGIESRSIQRIGAVPADGPESWSGGTLFPLSSKKVARGINAFSNRVPLTIIANLSGFDGSPESLRYFQLEYGAEIGRAIVNFQGPICFVVVARYHGGAYVVFSKALNANLRAAALEGSFASVIGGAPAAAVVFPKQVRNETYADERVKEMQEKLSNGECTQREYDDVYQKVYTEKQAQLGQRFDAIHSVDRAQTVGSIDDIITASRLRPYIIQVVEEGIAKAPEAHG